MLQFAFALFTLGMCDLKTPLYLKGLALQRAHKACDYLNEVYHLSDVWVNFTKSMSTAPAASCSPELCQSHSYLEHQLRLLKTEHTACLIHSPDSS